MLLLGLDIGSSSVKAALLDSATGRCLGAGQWPEEEMPIEAPQPGWAEQDPEAWWQAALQALARACARAGRAPADVGAVGISYQMHGLVLLDSGFRPLRPSIIWCDSRAVGLGARAFEALGEAYALGHLLNSPSNFTASKLAWVQENEPEIFAQARFAMLPGDYVALRLTGEAGTTVGGLSEGILWDFAENRLATELLDHFQIPAALIPPLLPALGEQGQVSAAAAAESGLRAGIPLAYRAGDQPNNALSLGVLDPGEVAATAGTSAVIYGVSGELRCDPRSRINAFAHVNHLPALRLGLLLCVNGAGILNRWLRQQLGGGLSYEEMNRLAASAAPGSEGLLLLPFGNGAERLLENRNPGAALLGLDLNRHGRAHLLRAGQEGIVFALRQGLEAMAEAGLQPSVIRAGQANMMLSELFASSLAAAARCPIELFATDGAQGAARAAGAGAGAYASLREALGSLEKLRAVEPDAQLAERLDEAYARWQQALGKILQEQ
jgi:xylulokinase